MYVSSGNAQLWPFLANKDLQFQVVKQSTILDKQITNTEGWHKSISWLRINIDARLYDFF